MAKPLYREIDLRSFFDGKWLDSFQKREDPFTTADHPAVKRTVDITALGRDKPPNRVGSLPPHD